MKRVSANKPPKKSRACKSRAQYPLMVTGPSDAQGFADCREQTRSALMILATERIAITIFDAVQADKREILKSALHDCPDILGDDFEQALLTAIKRWDFGSTIERQADE